MNLINKSATPPNFLTYSKSLAPQYPLPSKIRDEVIKVLRNEQGNICGYCQRSLGKKVHIEHYCEQSICNGTNGKPDLRVNYNNYLLVCDGNQHNANELTCDKKKANISGKLVLKNKYLPISVNPWKQAHIDRLSYSIDGSINSTDLLHLEEMNVVLNLNDSNLKKMRKDTWIQIRKLSRKKNGFGLDKAKLASIVCGRISDSKNLPPFTGLLNFLLKKYK